MRKFAHFQTAELEQHTELVEPKRYCCQNRSLQETDYNPAARKPLWLLFQDGDSPTDPFLAFSHHVSTQSRRIKLTECSYCYLNFPLKCAAAQKKNHLVPSGSNAENFKYKE